MDDDPETEAMDPVVCTGEDATFKTIMTGEGDDAETLLRDPVTGQVRAILRESPTAAMGAVGEPGLVTLFSRGSRRRRIPGPGGRRLGQPRDELPPMPNQNGDTNMRQHDKRQQRKRLAGGRVAAIAVTVLVIVTMALAGPVAAQDPRAPQPVGTIPVQVLVADGSISVNLSSYFSDPDGDALAYAATTSDVAVATVSVSAGTLTIPAVAPGTVAVTVLASDPGGLSAAQSTRVTVARADGAPEPVGTIPVQILSPGQWASVNVVFVLQGPRR